MANMQRSARWSRRRIAIIAAAIAIPVAGGVPTAAIALQSSDHDRSVIYQHQTLSLEQYRDLQQQGKGAFLVIGADKQHPHTAYAFDSEAELDAWKATLAPR